MATYDSFISGQEKLAEDPNLIGLDTTPTDSITDSFLASYQKGNPVKPQKSFNSFSSEESRPTYHLMEKIYFFPFNQQTCEHRIDAGLVASDIDFTVSILNLKTTTNAVVSNITAINGAGTSLDNPSTPFEVLPLRQLDLTLTISEAGPAIQETEYRFTIDGVLYILYVTAERLKQLDPVFQPNWGDPVRLSYSFETVIFRNKVFKEQRRPLYNDVNRAQEASFLVHEGDFEKAHNILKRSHDKLFFVPIFSEVLTPSTSPLQGSGIIDLQDDISHFWNLKNLTTVILLQSTRDNTLNEYLTIDSLDEGLNRIVLDSPISKAFVTPETFIMPIFVGRIDQFEPVYETDKVVRFSLSFYEVRLGE